MAEVGTMKRLLAAVCAIAPPAYVQHEPTWPARMRDGKPTVPMAMRTTGVPTAAACVEMVVAHEPSPCPSL